MQVAVWQGWILRHTSGVPCKRQVRIQDIHVGCRSSWRRTFCSIMMLVGPVLSNVPTGFHIMLLCVPQFLAPHTPYTLPAEFQCTRKATMLMHEDAWKARNLSFLFTFCDFRNLSIMEDLRGVIFTIINLPLIEYENTHMQDVQLITVLGMWLT